MKRFLIIISLFITSSMYGQIEHYSFYIPLIDESIQYLKDNINTFSYSEIRENLLITESGQIYENPYIGVFIYEKIHDLLLISGEKSIFEKEYREVIFKRLKISKDYDFAHWKIIVLHIKDNYTGIVFKKGFTREDDKGIHCYNRGTAAFFLYEYNEEQKKHFLKEAILETNLKK